MKKLFSLFILLFAFTAYSNAQDVTGVWKTIDDETGEAKSHVTIYEQDGKYYGKITTILTEGKQNSTCTKCSDHRKNKPIQDMIIIEGLEKTGDSKYSNGKILDPTKGKIYDVTLTVNGDELTLKGGYKVFGKMVGRTQTWYKIK